MSNGEARAARLNRLARWTLALGSLLAVVQLARIEPPSAPPRHLVILSLAPEASETLLAASTATQVGPLPLDRFLGESTVFRHAIAQADSPDPSLRSLFTGRYPTATLLRRGSIPAPTLADEFRKAGFRTAAFPPNASSEKSREWLGAGFESWRDEFPDNRSRADAARQWLSEQDSQRSFLFLHIDGPDPVGEAGRFLEGLRADGFLDRALVVMLTPHAKPEAIPQGVPLHEHSLRVPLAFRLPQHERRRFDQTVELIDVAPTLHGLFHLPGPRGLPGQRLHGAIWIGTPPREEHLAYAQRDFANGWHALVGNRFELLVHRGNGRVLLFDLDGDPTRDIGDDRRVLRSELRQILKRRLIGTSGERSALLRQANSMRDATTAAR